ncbi:expressed protein [Phakopsora pachyrhizi]|uniref:Mediator of RNA polymerase II transcription subunit 19 n=1 Tax=Phakopsora pachyrhizi TaxID=170000 RepID=A0AAV0BTS8_PHAPC|nr:expressed protein [Phakopsora pachyrhizi]
MELRDNQVDMKLAVGAASATAAQPSDSQPRPSSSSEQSVRQNRFIEPKSSNLNPSRTFIPVIDHGLVSSAPISGSHDLLSLFDVMSVYDRFVKPYLKPLDQPTTTSPPMVNSINNCGTSGDLKGKAKAEVGVPAGSLAADHLGQKRMKMEKSYGHFVADVGGRNSIKKDHQLQNLIMDPTFEERSIPNFMKPFNSQTLAQAFTLHAGVLPGFDSSIWIAEEGGPKRKRKKRKQGEMAGPNENGTTQNTHQALPNGNNSMIAATAKSANVVSSPPKGINSLTNLNLLNRNNNGVNGAVGTGNGQSNGGLIREEEHRKKKRTKLSSNTSSTHQIALQL